MEQSSAASPVPFSVEPDPRETVAWYVMRAYKSEARVEELLQGPDGLPYFIPKHYVLQNSRGKKVRRLVPAIRSLVFVHASRRQINAFKLRCPLLQYVMWKKSTGLEYLQVPDRQMDNFLKVARQHDEELVYYQPQEINFHAGTHIRMIGGLFDGAEGYFVKLRGKRSRRLVVKLDGIAAIAAEVTPEYVEIIPEKEGQNACG